MFRAQIRGSAKFARRAIQNKRFNSSGGSHGSKPNLALPVALFVIPLAAFTAYEFSNGVGTRGTGWAEKARKIKKHKDVPQVDKLEEVMSRPDEPKEEPEEEETQEETQEPESEPESEEAVKAEEHSEKVESNETQEAEKVETAESNASDKNDALEAVSNPAQAEKEGAYDPETGEINWDCPCLGGMADGPCGEQFKEAFSCFVYSKEEPKGVDCIEKFKAMQDCFREHPDVYAAELSEESPIEQEPLDKSEVDAATAPAPADEEPASEEKKDN